MCVENRKNRVYFCGLQMFFVFCWAINLLETDSFYSVYILCAILAVAGIVHHGEERSQLQKGSIVVLALASAAFSLAAMLANYRLFLPVRASILKILSAFAGGFTVCWNILAWLCKKVPFRQLEQRNASLKKRVAVFFLSFCAFTAVNLAYLFFASYPGILTPDSLFQIEEIHNGYTSNHHPFWHTVVIAVFFNLGRNLFGNSNAAVATYSVASVLFMASCFSYTIVTLYRAGATKKALLLCGLIYVLAPYHIAYSVTMWKDVAFSAMVLILVVSLFRVFRKIGHLYWNLGGMFISGIAISVWRSNGWLALIAFVACLVLYCLLYKEPLRKPILALFAAILVGWFMRSPVLSAMNITQPDLVESLSVPVQQIARVISENRELSAEETELLSRILDIEEIPELYKPYISDPIKHEIRTKGLDYFIANKATYLKLWVSLGLRYPGDYIKAWVDQTRGYYNGGYLYWVYSTGVRANEYGITTEVEPNVIQGIFEKYFNMFSASPLMEPIKSIGLHVWGLCALLVVSLIKKRKELLLCILPLMVVGTLLVATPVFSEFRYAYSVFTTIPFLTVICLNVFRDKEGVDERG